MDGVIGISGVLAFLLVVGGVIGALRPSLFSWRWLLVAAGLVLLNDALLTQFYGLAPDLLPHSNWNWQGKILALIATLVIAALATFGWRRCGLTLKQAAGSLKAAAPVALIYIGFFLVLALVFPNEPASRETVAFQLTLPGFEEEPFYRGLLLFALDRAFLGRKRLLGVDWGIGAILSCVLFGLAHAFGYSGGYSGGQFSFDALTMVLTGGPSLIAVWIVLKTRSVLLPVVMHNFGNAIMLVL